MKITGACLILACSVLSCSYFQHENAVLYKAVPSATALVLEAVNVRTLQAHLTDRQTMVGRILNSVPAMVTLRADLTRMDAVFQEQPEINAQIQSSPVVAAFSLLTADSLHPVLIYHLKKSFDLSQWIQSLPSDISRQSTRVDGRETYTLFSRKFGKFSLLQQENILIAAHFAWQTEDVAVHLEQNAATNWTALASRDRLMPGEHAKISLLCETTLARLSEQCNPEWRAWLPALAAGQKWYSLHWGPTNYHLRSEAAYDGDTADKTVIQEALSVAPSWAGLLQSYQWTGRTPTGERVEQPDFERYLKPLMTGGCVFLAGASPASEQFWLIHVKDPAAALERMTDLGQATGSSTREEYQTYACLQLANGAFLEPIAGKNKAFQTPSCAVIGNFLVFAATRAALERLIDRNIVWETLINTPGFLESAAGQTAGDRLHAVRWSFLRQFLTSSGIGTPAVQLPAEGWLTVFWQPEYRGVSKSLPRSQNLSGESLQPDRIWKYPLRHPAVGMPSVAVSEDGKDHSILIQDAGNNLYCLTPEGRLVWERYVGAPLLSPVQAIDWNGNGISCFLFNTANAVYVLDHTGTDVPGFPLALKNKACGPVSAVRYGDTGRYQFFQACEPDNIYAFDHFGRPLDGWNPLSGCGRITQPVRHFQFGGKDYHILLSGEGRLSMIGRNGRLIVPATTFAGWNGGIYAVTDINKAPTIYCFNKNGRMYVGNVQGKFTEAPGNHPWAAAAFDEHATGGGVCMLSDVHLYYSPVSSLPEGQFTQTKLSIPMDTVFVPAESYWGLLSKSHHQIFLIGADWPAERPLRLAGSTPFVIMPSPAVDQADIIIVGLEKQLLAYQIHKRVQN